MRPSISRGHQSSSGIELVQKSEVANVAVCINGEAMSQIAMFVCQDSAVAGKRSALRVAFAPSFFSFPVEGLSI